VRRPDLLGQHGVIDRLVGQGNHWASVSQKR
jgi:hypothetical protein